MTNEELSTIVETPPTSGSASAPESGSGASPPPTRRSPTSRCPPRVQHSKTPVRTRPTVDLLGLCHGHARHDVPDLVRDPRGQARDATRGRVRPPRGVYGLRVRSRTGVRDARIGPLPAEHSSWAEMCSRRFSTGRIARRSSCSATARVPSSWSPWIHGGFLGFELGADGGGGECLWVSGIGLQTLRRTPTRT